MKLKILKTIIVLSLSLNGNGQEVNKSNPTGYSSLNVGIGIPLGEFSDETVGGAFTGGCFQVNYAAPLFHSNFGLATKLDIASYGMSTTPFITEQKGQMDAFGFGLQDGVDYKFKSVSSGSYIQKNVLLGLYVTAPIKRFSLDARLMGGLNFTDRPGSEIDFDLFVTGDKRRYYETESSSMTFAYDIGFGIRYNMGKKQKLGLMLNCDFIGAQGSFLFDTERLYYDSSTGNLEEYDKPTEKKASYSVSTYSITLGLGYVFGRKE